MLFILLLTACCCYGQASANVYDRFFVIYSLFLLSTLGTFIWSCWVRTQYTSKVCSGDFIIDDGIIDEQAAIILVWDVEHQFYLIECGRLLRRFIVVESLFFLCCMCAGSMWYAA